MIVAIVEGIHALILHLMARYLKDYFDHLVDREALRAEAQTLRSSVEPAR